MQIYFIALDRIFGAGCGSNDGPLTRKFYEASTIPLYWPAPAPLVFDFKYLFSSDNFLKIKLSQAIKFLINFPQHETQSDKSIFDQLVFLSSFHQQVQKGRKIWKIWERHNWVLFLLFAFCFWYCKKPGYTRQIFINYYPIFFMLKKIVYL